MKATTARKTLQDRANAIVAWLLGEERLRAGRMIFLLDRFARRLKEAGLPLDRVSLHIRQLHPQLASRSFIWEPEAGGATEMGYRHSSRDEVAYITSPIKPIYEGEAAIRRRLDDRDGAEDFPILDDLKGRGFTDYKIVPLAFANGVTNAFSLATQRQGGFTDDDLALLDLVLPAFATLVELQQTRRTARDLLTTYVGPNTGERIFSGAVQRGDGEVIHAILWYCDLRDFTHLSQTEPLDKVIEHLNTYFDCMAGPVTDRGGEILKFVGDAMLAIFSCDAGEAGECGVLDAALGAAEDARAGISALNDVRRTLGQTPMECGIAIHVGEVMYGNIGAADRLDFTVIGPAVNLVCRMETLCVDLDSPILVSREIADLAPPRFTSLGSFNFKGMDRPREVFAPRKSQ